jgi:hypothetical protein
LLRWTSTGIYSKAEATSAPWVLRAGSAEANPLSFSLTPIEARSRSCEGFDLATANGVSVYVWSEEQSSGRKIFATVMDDATGTRFQEATVLGTDTSSLVTQVGVRAVACGSTILVLYVTMNGATPTAAIKARALNTTSPGSFGSEVTVVSDLAVDVTGSYKFAFDALNATDDAVAFVGVIMGYTYGAGGGSLRFVYVNSAGATVANPHGGSSSIVAVLTAAARSVVLVRSSASSAYIFAIACAAGNGATLTTVNRLLTTSWERNIGSITGGFLRATAVELANSTFRLWLEPSSYPGQKRLLTATWGSNDGEIIEAMGTWRYNIRLGGHAFNLDGRRLVPLIYTAPSLDEEPGVQPTFFIADDSGQVVLRALVGESGGPFQAARLCRATVSGDDAVIAIARRGRVQFSQSDGALVDLTPDGIARLVVSTADPSSMGAFDEDGGLHCGGACPTYYDGAHWVEDGFHVAPEGVDVTVDADPGDIDAGTYSWCVCYEWTDAIGRVHRSAPSIPVSYTFGAGSAAASLTVPYLHMTEKEGVRLAVFRTTNGGTVFRRIVVSSASTIQPNAGAATAADATLIDDAADEDIEGNEILYASGPDGGVLGGELWHRPPPAYSVIFRHQDYLFCNTMEDGQRFLYSLPILDGEGTAWAAELVYGVPKDGGALTGFGKVDEKLVLLSRRAAYVVLGQGPLRDGQNNNFSEPQFLTGSQGCAAARSIVGTVDGLFHQSSTGLKLLTRSLETISAGAAVDAYANLTITRALEVPTAEEVRFYTSNGRTLVWNYRWKQWGTWTLQPADDACLLDGVAYFAASGSIRYEDSTTFEEAGQTLRAVIGTAWLRWAGFKGLQRVWRAFLEGETVSTVRLKTEVFVNDKDTVVQTNEKVLTGSGDEGPNNFSTRHHMSKQICRSMRLRFTITREPVEPEIEETGGRVSLTALSLEFGVHPGKTSKRSMRPTSG